MTVEVDSVELISEIGGLSRRQRILLLLNLALVIFFASISFSVLGPFFPREAQQKGLSVTTTGIIVGEFEFIIFITSPFISTFASRAGSKFVYTWGLVICGVCSILFGILEYCPAGLQFALMCLATRGVCAVGTAMFVVSSFSIATRAFPGRLSSVFGALETASGVGYMVGPAIGGFLYESGGFKLPFIAVGSVLLIVMLVSFLFMPNFDNSNGDEESPSGSTISLLKLPFTPALLLSMAMASSFLGFTDVSFQPFLSDSFNYSPIIIGLVLFLPALVYAVTASLWGWAADTYGIGLIVCLLGQFIFALSVLFLHPAPFIPYSPNPIALYTCMVVIGLSCSAVIVPIFNILAVEANSHGFESNLGTYSIISGLINSAGSFGAFVGPTVGGALIDRVGFAWVLTGYSGLFLISCLVMLLVPIRINRGFKRRPTRGLSLINDSTNSEQQRNNYGSISA